MLLLKKCGLLFLLFPCALFAQKIIPTAEQIVGLTTLSEPRLSPDGTTVAFIVEYRTSNQTELWVQNVNELQPQSLRTLFKNPTFPRWSPNGKYLALIASDSTTKSNQLFIYSIEENIIRRITDVLSGVTMHSWRPDSKALAFTYTEHSGVIVRGATFVGESNWVNHLHEIEINTGQRRTIYASDHVSDFAYSPDGNHLLIKASNPSTEAVIYQSRLLLLNINSGVVRVLAPLMGDTPDGSSNMQWSPDGESIVAFLPTGKYKKTIRPEIFNIRENSWKPLFENYKGYINSLEWCGNNLAFTSYNGVKSVVGLYDLKQSNFLFEKEVGVLTPVLTGSYNGDKLAYIRGNYDTSPNLWVCSNDGKAEHKLTNFNPETASWRFGGDEVVTWKSNDGLPIEGVLLKPIEKQGTKLPLIVMIHGGPEWAWVKGWDPEANFFVNQGFAVLKPNIRGSQGYGVEFIEKNYLDLGGGDFEDVLSGIFNLASKRIVDADKVIIEGWSYGGYMTAWAISHSNLFKAAVVGAGPVDLDFQFRVSDNRTMWSYYLQSTVYENESRYKAHSPMSYLNKIKTPTLIIHGASDIRVPPLQAVQLYNGLLNFKIPTRLLLLEGERHGITKPSNRALVLKQKEEWYGKYLVKTN